MAYGSAPPPKRKPTPGANKLSSATLTKLQEHKKKGHSAKHMAKMRGRSFSQSHAMAMKMVGK